MFVISRARLQLAVVITIGFAASIASTDSFAYTPDQQQACSGDAMRLCGQEIPDVDRITLCMMRNRSQLTPQCRAYFHGGRSMNVRPTAAHRPRPRKIRRPADRT